jgi:C4-dicarboxylate transporter, DctQ subunit
MLSRFVHHAEEGILALLLGVMTLVTFSQVVARYVFNSGAVWALELTTYLFAWLVLFGISYGIRVGAHIGIDALVKLFRPETQRITGLIAAGLCMLYAVIMAVGSWNYLGTLYTLGIPSEDLPIPLWLPFVILPVGFALAFFRLAQVAVRIWRGQQLSFLGDEAEEALRHLDERADDEKIQARAEEIRRLDRGTGQ